MNGPSIETRARPLVFVVTASQETHYGRLLGRRGRSSFVAVVDARGLVRVAHARYAFPWWEPTERTP